MVVDWVWPPRFLYCFSSADSFFVVPQNILFKAIVFDLESYYYLQSFFVFVPISAQRSFQVQPSGGFAPPGVLGEMLAVCFA